MADASNVLALPTQVSVEAAWERHSANARRLIETPHLRNDSAFMAQVERDERRYRELFDGWCASDRRRGRA